MTTQEKFYQLLLQPSADIKGLLHEDDIHSLDARDLSISAEILKNLPLDFLDMHA